MTQQRQAIAQLEQALQSSRAQIAAQADQAQAIASLKQAHADLQQQYKLQGDRLRALEAQTHQATGVASIGEFYLNRWRKY
ncbi:hypothetical protein [Picosynechococcus sp. NKBG042902]|nr:hypothetical protein [Picosynechococcus sp. NKBG042902]